MTNLNRSTSTWIPREIVKSQAPFVTKSRVQCKFCQTVSGVAGVSYYGNKKLVLSLYQPWQSYNPIFSGITNLSSNYSSYICPRGKFKITIDNTKVEPVLCSLTPRIGMPSNDQASLQKDFTLPQSKTCVVGAYTGGKGQKVLTINVDASTLFGWDVTTVYASSFITSFGSNPTFETGALFVYQSVDGSTVPILDLTIEGEFDVLVFSQKPNYN